MGEGPKHLIKDQLFKEEGWLFSGRGGGITKRKHTGWGRAIAPDLYVISLMGEGKF